MLPLLFQPGINPQFGVFHYIHIEQSIIQAVIVFSFSLVLDKVNKGSYNVPTGKIQGFSAVLSGHRGTIIKIETMVLI